MQQFKNAEEYIAQQRSAIAANSECAASHYNLAVALLGQKKYDEAEKELFETIELSSTFAEAYVQLGGICLKRGDLEGCLKYNQLAVTAKAAFSEGHANIGFVHLQKGEIDDAIKALQKAIAYNSKFLQAFATLANAYLMKGLIDESIKANLKALSIEPDFAVVHNNIAIAYMEKGDFDLAIKHCDKAVELGYEVPAQISEKIDEHR